jgi:hypothetical protein
MGNLGKKDLILKVKIHKFTFSNILKALAFVSTALICVSFAFPEWVSFPSGETAGVFQNCLSRFESSADGRYDKNFFQDKKNLFQVTKIAKTIVLRNPNLSQNVL